jgi:hypothetical protein
MGNSQGIWRTPTFGPLGKGWPDLVLIRGDRMIMAELKSQKGVLTSEQKEVHLQLMDICRVYVWRPSDFNLILEVLTNA